MCTSTIFFNFTAPRKPYLSNANAPLLKVTFTRSSYLIYSVFQCLGNIRVISAHWNSGLGTGCADPSALGNDWQDRLSAIWRLLWTLFSFSYFSHDMSLLFHCHSFRYYEFCISVLTYCFYTALILPIFCFTFHWRAEHGSCYDYTLFSLYFILLLVIFPCYLILFWCSYLIRSRDYFV